MKRLNLMRSVQLLVFILTVSIGCKSTGHGKHHKMAGTPAENATAPAAEIFSGDAVISITTSKAVPLYKQIHSGCVIDIFFGKGMTGRDILAEPYYSWIKALNLNSLQYSGGSTSDHDHVIIGDTLIKGGKGDGYNIRREDVEARGGTMDGILDGVGNVKFGVDFFNQYCALLHRLNIRGDVIANVQSGTLPELYWKIQRANAQRVIFGMEQNISSNNYDFPDGNAYRKKISVWIDSVKRKFPGIITVVDGAPVYKQTSKFAAWNKQLEGIPGDEARLYIWDKDLFGSKESDAISLDQINQAFAQTIPQWLNVFKSSFPGKKVSFCQWGIKSKNPMYNTMLSCLYIAKFYEFMIGYNKANGNFIGYASFMPLKSLNRGDGGKGDADNIYKTLKACGMLFSGNQQVDDMTVSGGSGVTGIVCSENGKYTMMLINETGNTVNFPAVKINGTAVSGKKFAISTVSAASLNSYEVEESTSSAGTISLRPFSVNMISF
ncbi:MAG: hypothetical protein K1X61_05855 [Chitinophagales bacterium]|nr:hypothetical protein [Chitinophagales bacterium]